MWSSSSATGSPGTARCPSPSRCADFGGAHPGLAFASTSLAATHGGLTPQFAPGLALLGAGGWWIHGMTTAALASPVLGALAVLTFGGLAGRLAGPQWAPPAALILAVTLPQQYTSRSAFTEPLAQLLLLGGMCLVADSLTVRADRGWLTRYPGRLRWPGWLSPGMAAAALGGLALGLASLASLNVLPALIPVIPFTGLLVAARRPQALPLACGVLAGAGYGLLASWLTAPASLAAPGFPVRPVILVAAGVALVDRGRRGRHGLDGRPGLDQPGGPGRAALAGAGRGRRARGGGAHRLPDPAVGADGALESGAGHGRVRRRAAEAARPAGPADPLLRGGHPVLGHLVRRHPGAAARRVRDGPADPPVRARPAPVGR